MQKLRLDHVAVEIPRPVKADSATTPHSSSLVFDVLIVVSIFLIGMAAGNIYHPYQGQLAIFAGTIGIIAYCCHKLYLVVKRNQMQLRDQQISASLNARLQKHVAHSFRPHNKRRHKPFIADRYRNLQYVPIAHVDQI